MACSCWKIENLTVSSDIYNYSDCDGVPQSGTLNVGDPAIFVCGMSAPTSATLTISLVPNSNCSPNCGTLVTQTPTATQTPTITPTNTTTPTPTPTIPNYVQFSVCGDSTKKFRFNDPIIPTTVGITYFISGSTEFNGCATVETYTGQGPIYQGAGVTFSTLVGDCNNSLCECPIADFCFRTSLPSLSGYNGNYIVAGTYNSKLYYVGSGDGVVYYTGQNWCLSSGSTPGSQCILNGATPCYSDCPDISANLFNFGICPTPTPTVSNCDTFSFNALFDCALTPTPSSPVNCDDAAFDVTSVGLTPTPTPTQPCNVGLSFSISYYSPSPTPTATPTTTPKYKDVSVGGQAKFLIFDETFSCLSTKVLVDCDTNEELYTTDDLIFNEIPIVTGITMGAYVNGIRRCLTYVRDDENTSSNAIVNSIEQIYGTCGPCRPTPTPTPTQTQTPTQTTTQTPTPTTTQTPTQTQTTTQTTTQTPTNTETPTQTPTNTITPTPSRSVDSTPPPTSSQTATPTQTTTQTPTPTTTQTPTNTTTPTQTPTNTTTPTNTPSTTPPATYVYVFESCTTNVDGQKTQLIQTVPLDRVITINQVVKLLLPNNQYECWTYVGIFESPENAPYQAPTNMISSTYAGNYFASGLGSDGVNYANCTTCAGSYKYRVASCVDVKYNYTISSGFGLGQTSSDVVCYTKNDFQTYFNSLTFYATYNGPNAICGYKSTVIANGGNPLTVGGVYNNNGTCYYVIERVADSSTSTVDLSSANAVADCTTCEPPVMVSLRYYTLLSCDELTTYTSYSLKTDYTVGTLVVGNIIGGDGHLDCATITSIGEIITKPLTESVGGSFTIDVFATQPTTCSDSRCPQTNVPPINSGGSGGGTDPFASDPTTEQIPT